MSRDYMIGHLARRLMDEGIITARTLPGAKLVVWQWIKSGKLQLRQRPHTGWNIVNDEEVQEIVDSFKVGGKGYWHANI